MAGSKPWAAVGQRGGQVHVVDITDGAVIAHVGGQGISPQVAWLEREDLATPLLVIASGLYILYRETTLGLPRGIARRLQMRR